MAKMSQYSNNNKNNTNTPPSTKREMTLADLFRTAGIHLPEKADPGFRVDDIEDDSRAVKPGCVFIAAKGEKVDGHDFIPQALAKGAIWIIAERIPAGMENENILLVADTRRGVGRLAHAFYGLPARAMDVVGITGTNGKTTTAYLVEALLQRVNRHPALFGTVEYRFGDIRQPAATTTPGALFLARKISEARDLGADSVVMEVSSHALAQGRIEGIEFAVGLMTNLTQDHLDFHETMEEYRRAKHLFFTKYKPRMAVFNLDDPTARDFSREHDGKQITYALGSESGADIAPQSLRIDANSIEMLINFPGGIVERLKSPLRGRFNASNLLAAASAGFALGLAPKAIVAGLAEMRGAPGRFESVEAGQPFGVYVDYAHTPDAVERILENVRAITTGRVIAVQGCGGDRDPKKRPIMGALLGRLADYSIITNDNPRTEDPSKIAVAMEEGIRSTALPEVYEVCLDRREAIRRALERARPGDSVVVAGKGHETYQEVNKVRHHFDDREVVRAICEEMFDKTSH